MPIDGPDCQLMLTGSTGHFIKDLSFYDAPIHKRSSPLGRSCGSQHYVALCIFLSLCDRDQLKGNQQVILCQRQIHPVEDVMYVQQRFDLAIL